MISEDVAVGTKVIYTPNCYCMHKDRPEKGEVVIIKEIIARTSGYTQNNREVLEAMGMPKDFKEKVEYDVIVEKDGRVFEDKFHLCNFELADVLQLKVKEVVRFGHIDGRFVDLKEVKDEI